MFDPVPMEYFHGVEKFFEKEVMALFETRGGLFSLLA
jgi:hypothetical protein